MKAKKINLLKLLLSLMFIPSTVSVLAQNQQMELPPLPKPKRFIDKVEVIAGPSLSFNYGNKFIENYKDANVQNKRLMKVGYTFGLGLYHPISDRVDLNVRLQYDCKGTRTELNVPVNPVNDDSRLIINSDYSYRYLTLSVMPRISMGERKQLIVAVGAYFSRIRQVYGYDRTRDLQDNTVIDSHFKGRVFVDLRPDGGIYSSSWQPLLTGVEKNDFGAIISIGYVIKIKERQSLIIQIVDNFGLRNINRNNFYNREEKNHTVTLTIGYVLQRFDKK